MFEEVNKRMDKQDPRMDKLSEAAGLVELLDDADVEVAEAVARALQLGYTLGKLVPKTA